MSSFDGAFFMLMTICDTLATTDRPSEKLRQLPPCETVYRLNYEPFDFCCEEVPNAEGRAAQRIAFYGAVQAVAHRFKLCVADDGDISSEDNYVVAIGCDHADAIRRIMDQRNKIAERRSFYDLLEQRNEKQITTKEAFALMPAH